MKNPGKMLRYVSVAFVALLMGGHVKAQNVWDSVATGVLMSKLDNFEFIDGFAWYLTKHPSMASYKLFTSTNTGESWTPGTIPACPTGQIFDAFAQLKYFSASSVIYRYANIIEKKSRIYRSSDGGATMDAISDTVFTGYTPSGSLGTLHFANNDIWYGWNRVSYNSDPTDLVYFTKDGGVTWTDLTPYLVDSLSTRLISDMQFVNSDVGFIVGYDKMLKTSDGGVSWHVIDTALGFGKIIFTDENIGYFVQLDSYFGSTAIHKTLDGGTTWEDISGALYKKWDDHIGHTPASIDLDQVRDLSFFDKDHGIIVGQYNATAYLILRTEDGGQTWAQDSINSSVAGISYNGSSYCRKVQYVNSHAAFGMFLNTLIGFGAGSNAANQREISHPAINFTLSYHISKGNLLCINSTQVYTIGIYSPDGGLMREINADQGANGINVSGWPRGTYIIRGIGESFTQTKMFTLL